MKSMSNTKEFNTIYSSIISVVILVLLLAFVSTRDPSLSSISTDFRWRKNLIAMYTTLRFDLGDRVFNTTIVGEDGWFFYSGNFSVSKYQKSETIKAKDLRMLQTKLDQLNKELRAKNIVLLVIIPPDKTTVYPQYMPSQIPVIGEKSPLDQFIQYMRLHDDDNFILDLRPVLMDASQSQDVYYKTDTHWNDFGAYYAYASIMNTLASDYPSLASHPLADFERVNQKATTRDLPYIMGFSSYLEEEWKLNPRFETNLHETSGVLMYGADAVRVVTNSNSQLPKLLVFHDSFYSALAHFIEPHFGRTVTIPYTDKSNIWSLDWIERENPDIVIIEVVERYLDVTLPNLLDD